MSLALRYRQGRRTSSIGMMLFRDLAYASDKLVLAAGSIATDLEISNVALNWARPARCHWLGPERMRASLTQKSALGAIRQARKNWPSRMHRTPSLWLRNAFSIRVD